MAIRDFRSEALQDQRLRNIEENAVGTLSIYLTKQVRLLRKMQSVTHSAI
jgi:hypothetical protein